MKLDDLIHDGESDTDSFLPAMRTRLVYLIEFLFQKWQFFHVDSFAIIRKKKMGPIGIMEKTHRKGRFFAGIFYEIADDIMEKLHPLSFIHIDEKSLSITKHHLLVGL